MNNNWLDKLKATINPLRKTPFFYIVILFLPVSFLHIFLYYYLKGLPFGLLYTAVFIFYDYRLCNRVLKKQTVLLLLFPFLFFSAWYVYILWVNPDDLVSEQEHRSYYILLYLFFSLAYTFAPLQFLLYKRYWKHSVCLNELISILQLCLLFFISACFFETLFLSYLFSVPFKFPAEYVIYTLLVSNFLLALHFCIISLKLQYAKIGNGKKRLESFHATLPDIQFANYESILKEYMEKEKIYLRYDISLDLLAQKTGIPKHHLSELFNQHMNTSFYLFVATYRIQYVLKNLATANGKITAEGFAYECGFNSKTTFNKYFKEITGYSFSEYKNKKI